MKLPWWQPELGTAENALVAEVLASNYLNDGDVTTRFEQEVATIVGCRHAVAVTSGTTAIYVALMAAGVGHGDEVLVPDITFIATANAVTMTGAKTVLVDVDPHTLNMDPIAAAQAITAKTKAIVPVHVSGRGADMPRLLALANKHKLALVEDAAEALLSRRFGSFLGTQGLAGCISFSPNKTITTGQGGMVFTNDDAVYQRLKELKDQGRPVRGTGGDDAHPALGFNFKFTNMQAAVGLGQLKLLDERVCHQRALYDQYRAELNGIDELEFPGFATAEGETPQWVDVLSDRRDELDRHLESQGMGCRRFWHPIHTNAFYRQPNEKFPVSTRQVPRALWLPSAFQRTEAEIHEVCKIIRKFFGK
jgi:perosamine synthetase